MFLALSPGDQVLAADRAGAYRRLVEAEGREPRFIAKPGNWLKHRGWLDDMDPPSGGRRVTPGGGPVSPKGGGDSQSARDALIAEAKRLRESGAIYG